ncbi:MAG: hypothetical protein H6555_06675 [Lewinellaceae bacterium]|nr:hypothetical protein [Lewinellaceae bacterium]
MVIDRNGELQTNLESYPLVVQDSLTAMQAYAALLDSLTGVYGSRQKAIGYTSLEHIQYGNIQPVIKPLAAAYTSFIYGGAGTLSLFHDSAQPDSTYLAGRYRDSLSIWRCDYGAQGRVGEGSQPLHWTRVGHYRLAISPADTTAPRPDTTLYSVVDSSFFQGPMRLIWQGGQLFLLQLLSGQIYYLDGQRIHPVGYVTLGPGYTPILERQLVIEDHDQDCLWFGAPVTRTAKAGLPFPRYQLFGPDPPPPNSLPARLRALTLDP